MLVPPSFARRLGSGPDVDSTTSRRRRAAIAVACGLAIAAFAFGVALGGGEKAAPSVEARDSAVSKLDPSQMAGERIVTGFTGPAIAGQGPDG